MQILKSILVFLKNKFSLIQWLVIAFLIFYLALFGNDSLIDRFKYNHRISQLNSEIKYYEKTKYNDSIKLEGLNVDKKEIEKFGREVYLMKKSDEDLFIIRD